MAQHDYVIANGTGAAVRSDLNSALAAIVSNNSGATAPSPTYAYQLWADTTTNLLKLRNSANSAWITVGDLTAANLGLATLASPTFTGTVTIPTATISTGAGIPLASAASPAIYFTGDTNTGIYSPGADQFAITTGGSGRLFVDSSGRVGLGTSAPQEILEVAKTSAGASVVGALFSNFSANANTAIGVSFSPNLAGTARAASIYGVNETLNQNATALTFHTNANGASQTEKLRITSAGLVGIGTTTMPADTNLTVLGNYQSGFYRNVASGGRAYVINIGATSPSGLIDGASITGGIDSGDANGSLLFGTRTSGTVTEKARIDGSGRLLVGTSTARSLAAYGSAGLQVESTGYDKSSISAVNNENSADGVALMLGKSRGASIGSNTIVQSGDHIGGIYFQGADGSAFRNGASIAGFVDGTPGANDMPGRLVFSTTADGASSPTERMRITSGGYFKASPDATYNNSAGAYHEFSNNLNNNAVAILRVNNTSFADYAFTVGCYRSANSAYSLAQFMSGDGSTNPFSDREFNLRGDGQAYADGSWNGGGADYAEYFEWSDGNPDEEDRRGISVVLDGNQIRPAVDGEDPIGVISGNPSVVGDAAWNKWSGKYLRDDYGTYILEDYEVVNDEGETVIQQRRKLNPAYDPDQEYVSREDRPEWDCVGLMGKLRIRKGQPTGGRWIKMRDISDSVEEWLIR